MSAMTSTADAAAYDSQIKSILQSVGFVDAAKIACTLQGTVWRCVHQKERHRSVVIKATSKALHANKLVVLNGVQCQTKQNYHDVVYEQQILKYLCADKACPSNIIQYYGFFESKSHYFLAMEDGGGSLFAFVQSAHECIRANRIEIAEWHKLVKRMFKQMVDSVEYIHCKKTAHFDVSIENFAINAVTAQYSVDGQKLQFVFDQPLQCKLIDFGLATRFETGDFSTLKRCGKKLYKSPELSAANDNTCIDAAKNDVWCLGVCLFIMVIGSHPWNEAVQSDQMFQIIMSGHLGKLLEHWQRAHYVDADLLELFAGVFQYEDKRMSVEAIKSSRWLQMK
mmetsp:Transcript_32271/g.51746  ORF Transcript_32271/g.51746 Transcript_32271/m.51746 type:complete len:338 (+) Transcript_32271:42-1055(+)